MISINEPPKPKFPLGQVVATPGALAALNDSQENPAVFLDRHVTGDWGEVDQDDWNANDQALMDGTRLFSAYRTSKNVRLWVLSEADRSVTTILLPDEY